MALTDTLAGLYNRHGFVTIADEQLKLAHRNGNSVALAFVDLDGMKRINDELGHEFDDQALIATARILKSTFRASDLIARLGGEEFITLGVGIQPDATGRIRRRPLQNFAAHNKSQPVMNIAFSAGFASYKASRRDQKTIEQLMIEADQAMCEEKQSHHASRTFQDNVRRHAKSRTCMLPKIRFLGPTGQPITAPERPRALSWLGGSSTHRRPIAHRYRTMIER